MKSEETIKVLKRMLTQDLEADEFHAIKQSIKSVEAIERLKGKLKIVPMVTESDTRDEGYQQGYNDAVLDIMKFLKGAEK